MTTPDDTPTLPDHEKAVLALLEALALTLDQIDSMPQDTRDTEGVAKRLLVCWEATLKNESPAVCLESDVLREVLDQRLDRVVFVRAKTDGVH